MRDNSYQRIGDTMGLRNVPITKYWGKPASARITFLILLILIALLMSACGALSREQSSGPNGMTSDALSPTSAAAVDKADETGFDFAYSDRDKDASFDESQAVTVTLKGNTATATDTSGAQAADVAVEESTVTLTAEGSYVVRGYLDGLSLVVDASDEAKLQVVFDGVRIENSTGPAFLIENADKVFLTLADGSESSLSDGQGRSDLAEAISGTETGDTAGESAAATDAQAEASAHAEHDATLFSHEDLTINGSGSLAVSSASAHAIVSKDDLVVTGGTFALAAAADALQGKDCVKIADGNFNINAGDDAIVSTNTDEPQSAGFVSLDGGMLTISAVDDALHAETILRVAGGAVNVTACEEGFEAVQVWVQGGEHIINATDDGINAAGEARDDFLIDISGGTLDVTAGGDGIDSNDSLTQSGGTVTVNGPTSFDDGALDAPSATITGGTMLALGSAGMPQGYGNGSTQAALLCQLPQTQPAGAVLSLHDAQGAALFSYTAVKDFGSVAYSSPELIQGSSYTFKIDGKDVLSFTLSELVVSIDADGTVSAYAGGEFGGFGGPGGGPGGFGGFGGNTGSRPVGPGNPGAGGNRPGNPGNNPG
jgi:hypothetical protein